MRKMLVLALVLGLVGVAAATDLGNQAPVKVPGVYPVNVPNPILQGGDNIANATVIPGLPYDDSGTTVGYNDDFNSTCYFDNNAPDVVYSVVIPADLTRIKVSLCGSTYDTGLQILDSAMVQVACNDDFCGLQSEIEAVTVVPGAMYYIVVDGYSSASGTYVLSITPPPPPCELICPAASNEPEGEPEMNDGYVDRHNGGCNSAPGYPFQTIQGAIMPGSDIPAGTAVFCGVSGWYSFQGNQYRDTDWFILNKASAATPIEVTADAEYASYIFELGGSCAGGVTVTQQAIAGPCTEAFMSIGGAAGTKWFWVGPTVFASPDGTRSYDYIVWFSGLVPEVIPTETATWSTVKALYQ